jgi:hypothetical protein
MTMTKTDTNTSLVLEPGLSFADLERRLERAGWTRRPVTTMTPSILPGEPEVAQWRSASDEAILTYTFNPVVHLRVLRLADERSSVHRESLARVLPTLSAADIARSIEAADPRTILRGILAASETAATDLAGPIGVLAGHREPAVAEAAARVHLDLLHVSAAMLADEQRFEALVPVLAAICGNAMPLLAALPGATPDELMGLQASDEDCRAVFVDAMSDRVYEAYDRIFSKPERITPGPHRTELQVRACPASLFVTANPFSNAFPMGYRNIAPYLRADRVWVAWRYCVPGTHSGYALDGLVHARANWVWFPKIFNVLIGIATSGR